MLLLALPRRPRTLSADTPILENPPAFEPSPELAAIIRRLSPAGDIEEAWFEYDRRIDTFRQTNRGARMWRDRYALKAEATGITQPEHEILDDAYWAWVNSLIDHDEIERREKKWRRQILKDENSICGYCGGNFGTPEARRSHRDFCSFAQGGRIDLQLWRGKK